jgi:hypothetical protein
MVAWGWSPHRAKPGHLMQISASLPGEKCSEQMQMQIIGRPEKIASGLSHGTLQCCNLGPAHNHTTQLPPSLRLCTPSRLRDWCSWDGL